MFRRLRGKLTLSYTLTSVVTFLVCELLLISLVFWATTSSTMDILENSLTQQAVQTAPYFVHNSPDPDALTAWLRLVDSSIANLWPISGNTPVFLSVVDTQGQTLASVGSHPVAVNSAMQTRLSPSEAQSLQAVLADGTGKTRRVSQEADGSTVAIAPIVSTQGVTQGALVIKIVSPNRLQQLFSVIPVVGVTATVVTIVAIIAGIVFGILTSRGITRRLQRLVDASDKWSRGDFSAVALDESEDELGQAMRQLNRMAEQVRNLLKARQALATLEERNRLARDLHDSVKQQVFAVGMQIGATKVLLKRDVDAADKRLDEAQKLVRQAQQELTSLIRELRPVALEGKGLATALRELATQWTEQTGVVATVRVAGTLPIPLTVEEALFRVAQEALSNIVRHTEASLVQLSLDITEDEVTLRVADNGQGFDSAQQARSGALGVGLLSMQERMKALAGKAHIESTLEKGTRVIARCPRLGIETGEQTMNANGTKGEVFI
jgi:NarL family two-component system sensor histidine kinase LiaS